MNATTIAGRYKLEGRLGVGGMSTVHLAFDDRLERHVAIKLLAEHLADDPTFVSRFRREALAAARLVHPNIVQVFDFGFDEVSGQHFIVMEHVTGSSCAAILRLRGHLEVDETVDILRQACRGLDYAHRNGVVHRDVKPGNLLKSDDGAVKLADFGIAKATEQSSITQVGSVLGTAAYLAPEQARGEEAGPPSDLYSLAVVGYQLLSGRLPYEASSLSELVVKQQREAPTPLEQLSPDVPPTLAHAIEYGLEIDPRARPATAADFETAISAGARGEDPVGPDDATRAIPDTAATSLMAEPATRAQRAGPPTAATEIPGRRRLEPQPGPARPARSARPADLPPARRIDKPRTPRKRSRARRAISRFFIFLLLLLALGGAAVAAVVATNASNKAVHVRKVIGKDFNSVYNSMKSLVQDNTK
jgi:serine/threonine protein kinase